MKITRSKIRRLIKEQLSLVLEMSDGDDYLDRMAKSPASAGTPGIRSLKTARDISRGEADISRPPLSPEGKMFFTGLLITCIGGLVGLDYLDGHIRT